MADPPARRDTGPDNGDDRNTGADHFSYAATPLWVKVFGIIAVIVVALFVIVLVTGGPGGHGPGRHTR